MMAFETRLSIEYIQATLQRFQDDGKVLVENGLVWVKKMREYNKGGKTVQTRIERDVDEIKDCELKNKYIAYHYPTDTLSGAENRVFNEMKCNEINNNEVVVEGRSSAAAATATAFSNSGFGDNHHDKCAKAYTEITGQFSIPSGQYDTAIGYLSDVLDYYGNDWKLMIEEGRRTFSNWCARKTKANKPYSPLNVGWIEIWLSKLVPLPTQEPEMVILEPEFDPDQQAEIRARMKAMAEDKSR